MNVIHTLHPGSAAFAQPYEWGNFCIDVQRFGRAIRGELEPSPRLVRQGNHHDLATLIRCAGLRGEPISVDIETLPSNAAEPWTGKDPSRAALRQIGFGLTDQAISIHWEDADETTRLFVKEVLEDEDLVKVFQNGWWFDLPVLERYGMKVVNVEDTRDMRRAVASKSKLSLRYFGSIYTDIHDWKSTEDDDGDDAEDDGLDGKGAWATPDKDAAGEYNALDCAVTSRARRGLASDMDCERSKGAPCDRLYAVHTRLSQIYARANRVGLYVHKGWRGFMHSCLLQSIEEARTALREVTQEDFSCTPDAMRALIYQRHAKPSIKGYGLPDPYDKKMYTDETQKTIKVDENNLLMLLVSGDCPPPLVKAIDAYWHFKGEEKRLGVIKSEKFDQAMSADGRVHPGWNSCGTETMRIACSSPNVMNIEEVLRHIIAPAPGRAFCHVDKSQQELRIMEMVADDHVLYKALQTGDVYTFDALAWYKIDPLKFHPKDDARGPANKKDKKTRTRAKIGHLSRQYGAGDPTAYASALQEDRAISFNEIRLQGKSFVQTYYRTAQYWEAEMARVQECKYSEGRIIGGRLYHPAPPERSKAANFPVQRTAGEMMNLETLDLEDRLRAEVPDAEIVAQVHDAIDVECKESDVEKVKQIMKETHDREWTFCGKTRPFPIDLKVAYSSLDQTWADV